MPKTIPSCHRLLTSLLLLIASGCSPSDDRLVELGQQACQRQAEQNQTIAELAQQIQSLKQELQSSR